MRSRIPLAIACIASLMAPMGARSATAGCGDTHLGNRTARASGVTAGGSELRVFALQYRLDLAYVRSYATFRHKMECLFRDYVSPNRSATAPNLVVLNEDTGLPLLGEGTRGAAARTIAALPVKDPANLTGAIAAFAAVGAAYSPQIAYYAAREPQTSAMRLILAAATDTFVRGFMQTFSDLARRYGVYVVAANNQPEFREVRVAQHPLAAALIDPDLAGRYATGALKTVYEAVDAAGPGRADDDAGTAAGGINVYNKAFLWSPYRGVERYAAARFSRYALDGRLTSSDPRSNLIAVTKKTPVTPIERSLLDLTDDGDLSVENTGPFPLPGTATPANPAPLSPLTRIGMGISLPAFEWGNGFGTPPAQDPCARPQTWMRCLDARGVNVFLQPEANPGCCWAGYIDAGWSPPAWQALSWMDSAWRAVADPSVRNIRYAVTAHMMGNLVDLAFDGQSVIFERCAINGRDLCAGNTPRSFAGARDFIACPAAANRCDDPRLAAYAGPKRETIAMAPWVIGDSASLSPAANRARLAARSNAMLAGSGSPYENRYLETAIWADLDLSPVAPPVPVTGR
jgi:hypothetical protein